MSQHAYGLKKTVLIETSWNVKNYQLSFRNRLASINRNIVECKEAYGLAKGIQRIVLIETSWNVKTNTELLQQKQRARINRNIVECKDAISINFMHLIICINRSIVECKGTTLDLL